jgi:5-methylthioadenosine/S-adenosylhomocysteine deaminase
MALILEGHLVPMADADPGGHFPGRLYVDDDGLIADVRRAGQPTPAAFAAAPVVDLGDAFVLPGLIDMHSHIAYNALPLWAEPAQQTPYLHHNTWPNRPTYRPKISWPAWVLLNAIPEALLAYAQVRALAGGTTAIQGWPAGNRKPKNDLVRNVDDERRADGDPIRTSTLTLDTGELADRAVHLAGGGGFIYHCAEGRVGTKVVREFEDLAATNCLRQGLIAIHCSAIGGDAFERWRARASLAGDPSPGGIAWSPFSNLWLYGQTTDVPGARAAGVSVCLGTDWGPSGTKNLLGELKVASLWSEKHGWGLTPFDLVEMVTSTPGKLLSRYRDAPVGRLQVGCQADVAVFARRDADPWLSVVRAREADVRLVLIKGKARFGTGQLMADCGAAVTTSVPVGGASRRVELRDPTDTSQVWEWAELRAAFDAVRDDPVGAVTPGPGGLAVVRRAIGPVGDPLLLELDMPGGPGLAAGPPPPGVKVDIPPLPSLSHDATWRASIKQRGFHRILDRLDQFYA